MEDAPPVKWCPDCKQDKPLTPENWHRKLDGFRDYCKPCQRKRNRAYYAGSEATRASVKNYKANNQRRIDEIVREAKRKPCADCGKTFKPCQMDFDHKPEFEKSFNIFDAKRRNISERKLLEEMAKCDVVCACCHRLRTAIRAGVEVD